MKKLFFAILCLGVFFHTNAQDEDYDEDYEYVFDNHQFYLQVGPSIPTGGEWKSFNRARVGFALDLGTAFYLKRLNRGLNGFGFGIDWNHLDISVNRFDANTAGTGFNRISFVSVGSELGPIASFHIADGLNVDGFYRVGPAMLFQTRSDGNGDLNGHVGWKHALGASVRYRAMKLSLEADIGKLRETENNSNGQFLRRRGFHAFELKFGFSL
ncbi:MAG: hypothetical protein ACPGTP_09145 [Bacteroidia bacterium]